MSRYVKVRTPAGVLRRDAPAEVIWSGNEAVAELPLPPPHVTEGGTATYWTLDGAPVTEERAREVLAGLLGSENRGAP